MFAIVGLCPRHAPLGWISCIGNLCHSIPLGGRVGKSHHLQKYVKGVFYMNGSERGQYLARESTFLTE
jgi:hypothetical protein